jgi:hypothetical protein
MKKISFQPAVLTFVVFLVVTMACKVKKQTVVNDSTEAQSNSQLLIEKEKTTSLNIQTTDSSKLIKKDSSLISVTEKEDIEYDYPNPTAGFPSKVVRHTEKTTDFKTGSNISNQKNVKSLTKRVLQNREKKNGTKVEKVAETYHSMSSLISSSVGWIWIIGIVAMFASLIIYLIKKFNLVNLAKLVISNLLKNE